MTDSTVAIFPGSLPSHKQDTVYFDREELSRILGLYGRMVAAGEWRDYAIDMNREIAVFSIFRRTSEVPLYRIVKSPKLAQKQGAYTIYGLGGQILKRGHELEAALRILERKLIKAIEG
ncbi:DUF2794 domain-containing protein [Govanella unica]|uniref:DUF2794 domain-containing protein n=1 Tax=Govanella unica TaxID=2975056 RepID=A0A9X3TVU7_9PROT|nr:DUF2794 domain-containing protein [Govania unica]MDA5192703.1 DUF2794 domain-containing protein [Govania unica]